MKVKTEEEVEEALRKIDTIKASKYPGMTYEEGLDEALRWVLGEIEDEEFAPLAE